MALCAVTLDCADPLTLAAFYAKTTGFSDVDGSNNDFAVLGVWPGAGAARRRHRRRASAVVEAV